MTQPLSKKKKKKYPFNSCYPCSSVYGGFFAQMGRCVQKWEFRGV